MSKKTSKDNKLEVLIKQILKINPEKTEKTEKVVKIETESSEKTEEAEKIDDYFEETDDFKVNKIDFKDLNLTEETYDLFMKEVMPESYKLKIHYGDDVFEGYYDKIIESVKQGKGTSFSSMAHEYEAETLQNSLIIIRNAKEHKSTTMILSPEERACVDTFKSRSLTWWQLLYALEGKVIF